MTVNAALGNAGGTHPVEPVEQLLLHHSAHLMVLCTRVTSLIADVTWLVVQLQLQGLLCRCDGSQVRSAGSRMCKVSPPRGCMFEVLSFNHFKNKSHPARLSHIISRRHGAWSYWLFDLQWNKSLSIYFCVWCLISLSLKGRTSSKLSSSTDMILTYRVC